MGIGGWVTHSSTYWFSQIWNKSDLQTCLPISKELQRYITSWEALAQLCIILTVFQKRETRPGIINMQSGSDNTGAEANINHGFSTTDILAEIIKLASITQIQCNTVLNVHHIPAEKNIDADKLSRGKLSSFPDELRVDLYLTVILTRLRFQGALTNWSNGTLKFTLLQSLAIFFRVRAVLLLCLSFMCVSLPFRTFACRGSS